MLKPPSILTENLGASGACASPLPLSRCDSSMPTASPNVYIASLVRVKNKAYCATNANDLLMNYEKLPAGAGFIPYRLQGDKSLHTPQHTEWRRALKTHPLVLKGIRRFWKTLHNQRDMRAKLRSNSVGSALHESVRLRKQDYLNFSVRCCKALFCGGEFTQREAHRISEADWTRDQGDKASMTFFDFRDALFEIADMWTTKVDAEEYATFLRKLYDRITVRHYDGKKWKRLFKPLDQIKSLLDSPSSNMQNRMETYDKACPKLDARPIDPASPRIQTLEKQDRPFHPTKISVQISRKAMTKSSEVKTPKSSNGEGENIQTSSNCDSAVDSNSTHLLDAYNKFTKRRNNDWRPWWLKEGACPQPKSASDMNAAVPLLKTSASTPTGILDATTTGQAWSTEENNAISAWTTVPSGQRRKTSRLHEALAMANENKNRRYSRSGQREEGTMRRISFDATRGRRDEGIGCRDFTWARCEREENITSRRPSSASCSSRRRPKALG